MWNQASKLQIAHGDFLTFRVQDVDCTVHAELFAFGCGLSVPALAYTCLACTCPRFSALACGFLRLPALAHTCLHLAALTRACLHLLRLARACLRLPALSFASLAGARPHLPMLARACRHLPELACACPCLPAHARIAHACPRLPVLIRACLGCPSLPALAGFLALAWALLQDSEDPMSFLSRAMLGFDRMVPSGWTIASFTGQLYASFSPFALHFGLTNRL